MSNWYNTETQQNKNDWYRTEGQYSQTYNANTAPAAPKKKKSTLFRWIGFTVIIVLLIAASSFAFRVKTEIADYTYTPKTEEELPQDFKDFFSGYYTSVTTDEAKVDVPVYKGKTNFELVPVQANGTELSLQELYKNCVDSIVSIKAYSGSDITGYMWGSGVVLSEDGLILTNTHVIEGQSRAVVVMSDDTEYEAELIGADGISDLAVLKIDAHGLRAAEFGDSNELSVGDKVAAIGNPLSAEFRMTLTDGIISGIERGMRYNGHVMNLLQTNTAINNGNSGGALFNMYGQVIGITNMKMTSSYSSVEGIGFAIPSVTVASVANSLIKNGAVVGRTSIGITVGAIPAEIGEHYNLPEGVYISDVLEKSDAYAKGVRAGDIILSINGETVKVTNDIANIKDKLAVGDILAMTIWRDGEIIEIEVALMDTNDLY